MSVQQNSLSGKGKEWPLIRGAALCLALMAAPLSTKAAELHEVYGVEADDMLKLREGPGVGYSVVVGLPNGTKVWVRDCERLGHARWCKVSLDRARKLKGYASEAYLRKVGD